MNAIYVPNQRGPFEGMLQILRFNYPMFLLTAGIVAAIVGASLWLSLPLRLTFVAGGVLIAGWAMTTLLVSHYVYDRFPLFRFKWLSPYLQPTGAGRWINIHAGFDQTTAPLLQALAPARGTPIDLFDSAVMTEGSIRRARKFYPEVPGTIHGRYDRLPVADGSHDTIFMLFAAHELRTHAERATLFREALRVLDHDGTLIVVEHLRSPMNFLVFGPGAFHFHSRTQWRRAGSSAQLVLQHEFRLTPFATCFIWRKEK